MFRKIILSIAAVAMSMSVAAPSFAASSGCADKYENESRFNPTELSDFQKCVFAWNGTESGTVGSNFWFIANGEYFYMPLANLQGLTRDTIRERMVSMIVVSGLETKIEGLRADLASAQQIADMVPMLQLTVSTHEVHIAQLQSNIEEVFEVYLSDYAGDIFDANGSLTTAASSALFQFLDDAVADEATIASIRAQFDADDISYTWDDDRTLSGNIRNLLVDHDFHYTQLATIKTEMEKQSFFNWNDLAGWSNNLTAFMNSVDQLEAKIERLDSIREATWTWNATDGIMTTTITVNGEVESIQGISNYSLNSDNPNYELTGDIGGIQSYDAEGNLHLDATMNFTNALTQTTIAGGGNVGVNIKNDGVQMAYITITIPNNTNAWDLIEIVAGEAYEAGYSAGYDAGYEAGYNAGYETGFRDGVASVQ